MKSCRIYTESGGDPAVWIRILNLIILWVWIRIQQNIQLNHRSIIWDLVNIIHPELWIQPNSFRNFIWSLVQYVQPVLQIRIPPDPFWFYSGSRSQRTLQLNWRSINWSQVEYILWCRYGLHCIIFWYPDPYPYRTYVNNFL